MKKFLLTLLFGCGMLHGATAAESVVLQLPVSDAVSTLEGIGAYTSTNVKWTYDQNTWLLDYFNFTKTTQTTWKNIRTGNKTTAYIGTITPEASIAEAVTKVEVIVSRYQNSTNDKITGAKLKVSSSSDFADAAEYALSDESVAAFNTLTKTNTNYTQAQATTATFTFDVTAPAGGQYYRLEFDMPKTTNNGVLGVWDIKFYGEDGGAVVTPTVQAPVLTMLPGNQVQMTCETEGAEIRYTTDGTEPTSASTLYTAPITITEACTVKAITVKDAESSKVVTLNAYINTVSNLGEFLTNADGAHSVTVDTPITVVYNNGQNTFVTDGTNYVLVYGKLTGLQDVANGTTYASITGSYDIYRGVPELLPTALGEQVESREIQPTEYQIDEISSSMVNQYVTVKGVNITAESAANTFTASDGDNTIAIYNKFYNTVEVPEGDNFDFVGFVGLNNTTLQLVPVAITGGQVIEHVATPVFSVGSGSVAEGTEVVISTETEGASIYYTIDGTEPTEESTLYTSPVVVNAAMTIKAIAVAEGYLASEIAVATYKILNPNASEVTFDFATAEGLTELGLTASTTQSSGVQFVWNDVENEETDPTVLFAGKASMSFAKWGNGQEEGAVSATTPSTLWTRTADGDAATATELRAYANSAIDIAVNDNRIIKVVFNSYDGSNFGMSVDGTALGATAPEGSTAKTVWTWTPAEANVAEVHFLVTKKSFIKSVVVEYEKSFSTIDNISDSDSFDAAASAEYYNIQGVRVNSDMLTPGLYIVRKGNKASKVLVK